MHICNNHLLLTSINTNSDLCHQMFFCGWCFDRYIWYRKSFPSLDMQNSTAARPWVTQPIFAASAPGLGGLDQMTSSGSNLHFSVILWSILGGHAWYRITNVIDQQAKTHCQPKCKNRKYYSTAFWCALVSRCSKMPGQNPWARGRKERRNQKCKCTAFLTHLYKTASTLNTADDGFFCGSTDTGSTSTQ